MFNNFGDYSCIVYSKSPTVNISAKSGLAIGGIAGLIGSLVMLPYMFAVNLETNSPNIFNFQIVNVILFDNNLTAATVIGLAMHFAAGALIGMIFGAIIVRDRFLPKSIGNGISWGIVAGATSFAGLFVPTMAYLPKATVTMMHIEVPSMPMQAIEQMVQSSTGMILNSSLLDHVLYGSVLGAVTTILLFKKYHYAESMKQTSGN